MIMIIIDYFIFRGPPILLASFPLCQPSSDAWRKGVHLKLASERKSLDILKTENLFQIKIRTDLIQQMKLNSSNTSVSCIFTSDTVVGVTHPMSWGISEPLSHTNPLTMSESSHLGSLPGRRDCASSIGVINSFCLREGDEAALGGDTSPGVTDLLLLYDDLTVYHESARSLRLSHSLREVVLAQTQVVYIVIISCSQLLRLGHWVSWWCCSLSGTRVLVTTWPMVTEPVHQHNNNIRDVQINSDHDNDFSMSGYDDILITTDYLTDHRHYTWPALHRPGMNDKLALLCIFHYIFGVFMLHEP